VEVIRRRASQTVTMTRTQMLDYLADGAVAAFGPDIEVACPGAIDPTA
jgi:hypothetical protein